MKAPVGLLSRRPVCAANAACSARQGLRYFRGAGGGGLRLPASASCLAWHSHPAGRCPNSSSLFRPLAAVVAVANYGLLALNNPKADGLHTKIQVAALEDFLCCADFKSLTRRTVWQGCVFFLAKTVICKLFMNPIDKVGKQEYSFSSRTDRVLKQVESVRQEVLETVKQLKNSRCFPFGSISAPGF